MGLREKLSGLFQSDAREPKSPLEQARRRGTLFGLTPTPSTPDLTQQKQQLMLRQPAPRHIDLLFLHSAELRTVVKAVKRLTWKDPPEVVPRFAQKCPACGFTTEADRPACPNCEHERLEDPDPQQRQRLETFLREVNGNGQSLGKVGRRMTEDGSIHGRAYAVHRFQYLVDDDGRIHEAILQEVRVGDPRWMQPVMDDEGNMGGEAFICVTCRSAESYTPASEPGACPDCGNVLYDAWWMETGTATGEKFYLPNEVDELTWHYEDGTSPLIGIWDKILTLRYMDRIGLQAYDPRFGKAPGKILVTMGGDQEKMEEWADREQQKRAENPYRMSHLHVTPRTDMGSDQPSLDAKVVDVSNEFVLGQSMELREKYEQTLRQEYGLAPMQHQDVSGGGGLNNEGQQLRSTAQNIEAIHREFEEWFRTLTEALFTPDWDIEFPSPLEEDEQRDIQTMQAQMDLMQQAATLGLTVKWEGEEVVIEEGEVELQEGGGLGGLGGLGEENGDSDVTDLGVVGPGGDLEGSDGTEAPDVEQGGGSPLPWTETVLQQQVPTNAADMTESVKTILDGSGGPIIAQDELMDRYAGIGPAEATELQEILVDELTQPDGFSVQRTQERIAQMLRDRGFPDLAGRAKTITRTESAAIITEAKRRNFQQMAAQREEELRFTVRGADDFRTTKMSRWIRQQIPEDGLPLDELEQLLDRAVALAKQGAFTENGQHGDVTGDPIELPQGFRRRGFVTHFNDRDTVLRVT